MARAAVVSESAVELIIEAEEKYSQAECLEARLRCAGTQLLEAEEATNEYRLMSRELLPEKSAAEARAQSLELARDSFEMERDSSSKSHSDLLMQTWQLQARLQELEAENVSLRATQTSMGQEREWLVKLIQSLGSMQYPNGVFQIPIQGSSQLS